MAKIKRVSAFQPTSASDLKRRVVRLLAALACCTSPLGLMAQDLPTGGKVVSGTVNIGAAGPGGMTISQGSDKAIVNWNTFDVGTGQTLKFDQPGASSMILNRVTGATGTEIYGALTANGQVQIVNPNGIFIGPNGAVQAGGGFVASTLDISNSNFLAGNLSYSGNGASGSVVNAGRIEIGRGGFAALMGGHVSNAGTVTVPMGRVGFASGERVTLNLSGDGFMQVAVPTKAESAEGQALIENAGRVSAEGGIIEMTAATARNAVRQAINLSGVAEASSVSVHGGTITLGGGSGGQVTVSGKVTARANLAVKTSLRPQARPPASGGDITVTGAFIALDGARLNASGTDGGGLIRVGGDFAGAGDLPWAVELIADADTTVLADATAWGNGGRIVFWSDVLTTSRATMSARGGAFGGDGGFVEVSAKQTLQYAGTTDTRAPKGATGTLLLDPDNITVNPGGGFNNENVIEGELLTTNVFLDTSNPSGPDIGDITVNADIDWTTTLSLDLSADHNIRLNGAINGPNGTFWVSAQNAITTGPNGRVNVDQFYLSNGDWRQVDTVPSFAANSFYVSPSASFLRASGGAGTTQDPYEIFDVFGLEGIGSSDPLLASSYVLVDDIDAAVDWVFNPIGSGEVSGFSGTFDGDLYTISNLKIDEFEAPCASEFCFPEPIGLFGTIEATGVVRNLNLTDAQIVHSSAGSVAGYNLGLIEAVSVTGTVTAFDGIAGGIAAINNGIIRDSRAAVDVTSRLGGFSSTNEAAAGGAVGRNFGTIERTHAVGDVTVTLFPRGSSFPTNIDAGGFAGTNNGDISDSYAQGDVTATGTGTSGNTYVFSAGGFVGFIGEGGSIQRSYSTGAINFSFSTPSFQYIGGFAGLSSGGSTSGNFWDVTSSGQGSSLGATGLTTAQFQNTTGFLQTAGSQGWVFTGTGAVWAPGAAGMYPANYTTSPVIFVVPAPVTIIYGETGETVAPGTITGGPGVYVFDDASSANFARADILGDLAFGNTNVGTTTYGVAPTTITGGDGTVFDIIALPSIATVEPRPLTITTNNVTKTYGEGITLDLMDVTIQQDNGSTRAGLITGDQVTGILVTSPGTAADANVGNGSYAITASDASGPGMGNYTITYINGSLIVDRAPLQITAIDQTKVAGDTIVFDGTEYLVVGFVVAGDTVDSAQITSEGAPQTATAGPYAILISAANGTGLDNYDITYVNGTLNVSQPAAPPPPVPPTTLPNPADNVSAFPTFQFGIAGSRSATLSQARETLGETRSISDQLTATAASCSGSSGDVTRYLACLSDAMNDFSSELDAIASDLPPALANVAQIVQDARRQVNAAGNRAARRLAGATSDAERRAISQDAINEARAAVSEASTEIRKAISLLRADDPELAAIQRETITTVALAVDSVNIELSRAIGL